MLPRPVLDTQLDSPLYRQLYVQIKEFIATGQLQTGERLPATRELAGLLGLNRTTVSAAYELLESEGLIRGHVGRGSFVTGPHSAPPAATNGLAWDRILPHSGDSAPARPPADTISFATSRPSEELFPVADFQATCAEVLASPELPRILQLGYPGGYPPLRCYLLERARAEGVARPGDDIAVTSGCQQALDLLQRVLAPPGETVVVEDPVYPGLKNVFDRAGVRLAGVPVGPDGIDPERFERVVRQEQPRLAVLTPDFQNPTGATIPTAARRAILRIARDAGVVLVENEIYSDLRYSGDPLPGLKKLDERGDVVELRSFSKIAFPGLRVGWVIAPHALIARLAEAKQWTDLHSDQLSQAVLLRFAASGRLEQHRARMCAAGRERVAAVLEACAGHLPEGATFTRPRGGMSLWVRLPEPLDAGELLPRAQARGVTYLPGRFFSVGRYEPGTLRLSFAGLEPDRIREGLRRLGEVFEEERSRAAARFEPAPALV